jgi:hypothetical protein
VSLIRIACGLLLPAFVLLSSVEASASGYRVSYAIDAGDNNESGTVTCDYKSECEVKLKRLELSITFRYRDPVYRTGFAIRISGVGSRSGCCYFADGMDEVVRDVRIDDTIRLGIYVGRKRSRASEFLINEPLLGILYLQYSDIK